MKCSSETWFSKEKVMGYGRTFTIGSKPNYKRLCKKCKKSNKFELIKVILSKGFRLISFYPYSTTHYLECPSCGFLIELDSEDVVLS